MKQTLCNEPVECEEIRSYNQKKDYSNVSRAASYGKARGLFHPEARTSSSLRKATRNWPALSGVTSP